MEGRTNSLTSAKTEEGLGNRPAAGKSREVRWLWVDIISGFCVLGVEHPERARRKNKNGGGEREEIVMG